MGWRRFHHGHNTVGWGSITQAWVKCIAWVALIAVTLLLIFGPSHLPLSSHFRYYMHQMMMPFSRSSAAVSEVLSDLPWQSSENVEDIVASLRTENEGLKAQRVMLESELLALRQHHYIDTASSELKQYTRIHADILTSQDGLWARTATLSRGSKAGIAVGQIVMDCCSVVGRITEVFPESATLLLSTDSTSKIPVLLEQSFVRAIAVGRGEGYLSLDYMPANVIASPGEALYTTGDGGLFPAGLLIGTVVRQAGDEVLVRSSVDWKRLRAVQVLSK